MLGTTYFILMQLKIKLKQYSKAMSLSGGENRALYYTVWIKASTDHKEWKNNFWIQFSVSDHCAPLELLQSAEAVLDDECWIIIILMLFWSVLQDLNIKNLRLVQDIRLELLFHVKNGKSSFNLPDGKRNYHFVDSKTKVWHI